jgi:hypothetical protein
MDILGSSPYFPFFYIVLFRFFVPQPFILHAEVQFPFVLFDCMLIISSLDSFVLRLGILIY